MTPQFKIFLGIVAAVLFTVFLALGADRAMAVDANKTITIATTQDFCNDANDCIYISKKKMVRIAVQVAEQMAIDQANANGWSCHRPRDAT